MAVTLRICRVYGPATVSAMLLVVRVVQALLMLAALACGIGGVVVVGGTPGLTSTARKAAVVKRPWPRP